MCPHDGDDSLHTGGSVANVVVLVYTYTDGSCSNATEVRTLSRTDHKPIQRCQCTPQSVSDSDGDGYDHHCRQLTAEVKMRLRWELRHGCQRSECSNEASFNEFQQSFALPLSPAKEAMHVLSPGRCHQLSSVVLDAHTNAWSFCHEMPWPYST